MKFKERIKKALFAFFKEEIMNEFTIIENARPLDRMFKPDRMEINFCENRIDMQEFKIDFSLDDSEYSKRNMFYPQDPDLIFEQATKKARNALWDVFCQYVTVDAYNMLKPNYGEHNKFVFSIFLGRKRQ